MTNNYNKRYYNQLKTAQKASNNSIEAALLEYDVNGNESKVAWGFIVNPRNLEFSSTANYDTVAPDLSRGEFYYHSSYSGETLSIPEILIDTFCVGKSLKSSIDGLQELMKADPDNNRYAPKVLSFVWGTKRFRPCIVKSVRRIEERFLSGDPARIRIALVLQEIAKPPTKAQIEAREKKRQAVIADRNESLGKPRQNLTERQIKNAQETAKKYLTTNRDKLSPDLVSYLDRGLIQYRVNKESGDVTLATDSKTFGVVLRTLGEKYIANPSITTVPLKDGQQLPELK